MGGLIVKTIMLTNNELCSLTKFYLSNDIFHCESEIYRLDLKRIEKRYKIGNSDLLLKKYSNYLNKKEIETKIANVSKLANYYDQLNIRELNIPRYKVMVGKDFIGFALNEIKEARNLGSILYSEDVSINAKIYYLYNVGNLIDKVLKQNIFEFNFGDLHEYNFVVDNENLVYAIDLDDIYLKSNIPKRSRYLLQSSIDYFPNKYRKYSTKIVYPDDNTDLLCYNIMILNCLLNDNIIYYDLTSFQEYIMYLKYLGFGANILNSFSRLYSSNDNINPYSYLDEIPLANALYAEKSGFEKWKKVYTL